MKRTIIFVLLGISLVACSLVGCSSLKSKEADSNNADAQQEVVIGCDYYPPFYLRDEKGNSTGLDAEIATEAFSRMGMKAVFKQIPWEDKNQLLKTGEIDCVMSCFTMTGREDSYLWAGPYLKSRQVVAVSEDSDIKSLSDLEGKSIGIQATTKPEEMFLDKSHSHLPKIEKIISFSDRSYLYPAVINGYVDAIAAHEPSILQYEADYNIELRILDDPLLEVGLGVAFDKNDNSGRAQKLDETLLEMHADGTMRKLVAGYFENPDELLDLNGLEK